MRLDQVLDYWVGWVKSFCKCVNLCFHRWPNRSPYLTYRIVQIVGDTLITGEWSSEPNLQQLVVISGDKSVCVAFYAHGCFSKCPIHNARVKGFLMKRISVLGSSIHSFEKVLTVSSACMLHLNCLLVVGAVMAITFFVSGVLRKRCSHRQALRFDYSTVSWYWTSDLCASKLRHERSRNSHASLVLIQTFSVTILLILRAPSFWRSVIRSHIVPAFLWSFHLVFLCIALCPRPAVAY